MLLKYSEQTGYTTAEFNWACNVVDVVQSQVLYKHILNVEVSEIHKQLHNRRIQCLPYLLEIANDCYSFLLHAVTRVFY